MSQVLEKFTGFFEAEGLGCGSSKKQILAIYIVGILYLVGLVRSEQLTHFCIPIVTYGLSVFPWTIQEVVQFYVTTRRILSQTANNHPSSAIEHLYFTC